MKIQEFRIGSLGAWAMAVVMAANPERIPADVPTVRSASAQTSSPAVRAPGPASESQSPPRALNRTRIHAHYHNGDFDKVLADFALVQKSRARLSPSDSLFMEKLLAVVYAANPATRELGRYHMFKLLGMEPNADLIDLFVGEEVDKVFEKVKLEFALTLSTSPRSAQGSRTDTMPRPRAGTAARIAPIRTVSRPAPLVRQVPKDTAAGRLNPTPSDSVSGGPGLAAVGDEIEILPMWKNPGTWIGGGAALALAAISVYYSTSHPNPGQKTYVVPSSVAP